MTARSVSIVSRRPSGLDGQAELDVTPVMNMFIILIPFLVSMAVFTHLATHAFSLPADDGPGQARTADEVPLTVALAPDRMAVMWGDVTVADLPRTTGGEHDFAALGAVLDIERRRRPDIDAVVVAVDDGVVCAEVVRCLDRCEAAGFSDVGLAAGTNLDAAAAAPEVSP